MRTIRTSTAWNPVTNLWLTVDNVSNHRTHINGVDFIIASVDFSFAPFNDFFM
jgi:hypothetical protein